MIKLARNAIFVFLVACLLPTAALGIGDSKVSGSLVNGYRILPVERAPSNTALRFHVFRGDYIKFSIPADMGTPQLTIASMDVESKLTGDLETAPYFKMKTAGTYAFSLATLRGEIVVIEYRQPNYREVSAQEGAQLITEKSPLILDVRTKGEYQRGHIENATIIPVQVLQVSLEKISRYKNQTVFVYCATGNRSTVASKILIDSGFRQIVNLRHGIKDWGRKRYPVVK